MTLWLEPSQPGEELRKCGRQDGPALFQRDNESLLDNLALRHPAAPSGHGASICGFRSVGNSRSSQEIVHRLRVIERDEKVPATEFE
jgi:hypothetical protein